MVQFQVYSPYLVSSLVLSPLSVQFPSFIVLILVQFLVFIVLYSVKFPSFIVLYSGPVP